MPAAEESGKQAKAAPEAAKAAKAADAEVAEVADYAPPPVTDMNVMEVIANGNRRIQAAKGRAVIDLSQMGDSDSTALCALLEWMAAGKQTGGGIIFRNIQPRQATMLSLYNLGDLITPHCE